MCIWLQVREASRQVEALILTFCKLCWNHIDF